MNKQYLLWSIWMLLFVTISPHAFTQNCDITQIFAEHHTCANDGSGTVWIDVEFQTTGTDSTEFFIYGLSDGQFHGSFYYGASFYTFGPVYGNGEIYEFVIQDAIDSTCYTDYSLYLPYCLDTTISCNLTHLIVEPQRTCAPNGTFDAYISMEHTGTSSGFNLYVDGLLHSSNLAYPPSNEFVKVNQLAMGNQDSIWVQVADVAEPSCEANYYFVAPDCSVADACQIIEVETTPICENNDGFFKVRIDFQVLHPSSQGYIISVFDGSQTISESYAYDSNAGAPNAYSQELGLLYGDGQEIEVWISDHADSTCFTQKTFLAPQCGTTIDSCFLSQLIVEPDNCDANGFFNAHLSVQQEGAGESGFEVYVNGELHSTNHAYPAPNSFVNIEDLAPGNGDSICVTIYDMDYPESCAISYCLIAPSCGSTEPCMFTDVRIEPDSCDAHGFFSAHLSFNHQGTPETGFDVYVDNQFHSTLTTYPAPNDFIVLDSLWATETSTHVCVHLLDRMDNSCFAEYCFQHLCVPNSCSVEADFELGTNENAENSNPTFCIHEVISILNHTVNADEVMWYVDGALASTEPNPILSFEEAGEYTLNLVALQTLGDGTDCASETDAIITVVDGTACGACMFTDVRIEPDSCDAHGFFSAHLSFNHQGTPETGFDVYVDNQFHSTLTTYPAPNDFIVLDSLWATETSTHVCVQLLDRMDNSCFAEYCFQHLCVPNSCSVEADFELFTNVFNENTVSSNPTFCIQEVISVLNHTVNADEVMWYVDGALASMETNAILSFEEAGEYTLNLVALQTLADGTDCASETDAIITVVDGEHCEACDLIADIGLDSLTTICVGDSITFLNLSVFSDVFNSSWWVNGELVGQGFNLIHMFTQAGIYDIRLEIGDNVAASGCYGEQTITVEVLSAEECGVAPVCNVAPYFDTLHHLDAPICAGTTLTLNNGTIGATDFTWLVDSTVISFDTNPTHTFATEGIYNIELIAQDPNIIGCLSAYAIQIEVLPDSICNSACIDTLDCVLPGDIDGNGVVNALDLLRIGEAYAAQGPQRSNATTNFYPQSANNWTTTFKDGINHKHADTNGDGRVDEADVAAIEQNYAAVATLSHLNANHRPSNVATPPAKQDIRLRTTLVKEYEMSSGDKIYDFAVLLENKGQSPVVEDMYGVGFTLAYSASTPIDVSVQYEHQEEDWACWLGSPSAANNARKLLTIERNFVQEEAGTLEVAMTRIDHRTLNGTGVVCRIICIVTVDDWSVINAQRRNGTNSTVPTLQLNIDNVNLMDNDGSTTTLQASATQIPLQIPTISMALQMNLEGGYNADQQVMKTMVAKMSSFPLQQPFNSAPWNYSGTESVGGLPAGVVDWVFVEARTAMNPTEVVAQQAAFVTTSGQIVSIDGLSNGIHFFTLDNTKPYYVSIRHRNHLDVISATAIDWNAISNYDFTNPVNIMGGAEQLQLVDPVRNIYAFKAGDFDGNGIISVRDFNQLTQGFQQSNTNQQYLLHDVDFNGVLSIDDFNFYQGNSSTIGVSLIRY